jgi:hypothetical protein
VRNLFDQPAVTAAQSPSSPPFHHRYRFTFESRQKMTREQVQAFLKYMGRREGMSCVRLEPVSG